MGLIKAIGRWIGSVFVLTDWHAETSAGGRVVPVGSRVDGHDKVITRDIAQTIIKGDFKMPAKAKGVLGPALPPPPKPYANHNPNACPPGPPPPISQRPQGTPPPPPAPSYAKIPATSMFAPQIRHAEKLVVVQQLTKDEVSLIPRGVQRKWCGTSGGGVVVHDMNAVLTLVSLVKQVVGEGGGSPRWLSVRVVRLDGRAADYVINIADAEWSKAFEANNAHFVAGL